MEPLHTRFNGAATLALRKSCGAAGEHRGPGHASMGPQLYRCGNLRPYMAVQHAEYMLQWGQQLYRCGNHSWASRARSIHLSLQWGRNFIVAEILLNLFWRCIVESCFNGVATLSLRKLEPPDSPTSRRSGFNGAATLSLRKYATSAPEIHTVTRFNGAATLSLRKYGSRPSSSHGGCSFNGAATLSLRKFVLPHLLDS